MEAPKRLVGQRQTNSAHRLTRKRIPLSCTSCRVRKLKCNREKPCQNCSVRGESASSCVYAEKAEKRNTGPTNPVSDTESMRQRLSRLENSILSMLSSDGGYTDQNQKQMSVEQLRSPNPSNTSSEERSPAPEDTDQAGGQSLTIDTRSTHWNAILSELGAIKDEYVEEEGKTEDTGASQQSTLLRIHRPSLLNGLSPPPDRGEVLFSLPDRKSSDKLLGRFFEAYNPLVPARYLIHKPTFLKQYARHWENPEKSSIVWIGLLFAIYCISIQSYTRENDTPPEYQSTSRELTEVYRIRSAQCILIADITKPYDQCEFMVEALAIYSFAEYVEERDGDMGTWMLSGTLMKIALQQGYHRDPAKHPRLTVFQAEMRRRVWVAIIQHELLFSVQIGLPRSVRYSESDTEQIRNLYDHELYEEMTELPPSRPLTEVTEIVYQATKSIIMRAYGLVIEFLHILDPQPYYKVIELHQVLLSAESAIPSHLRLRTLEEMKGDPPSKIMERFILVLFWHKAVCVLHRKYWEYVPEDGIIVENFESSRQVSVASSMSLLKLQETMHQATRPGGLLINMRWWDFSLTQHDFLLAGMIICLDLMRDPSPDDITKQADYFLDQYNKLNALLRSRSIWAEVADKSRDARRAVSVLTSAINKVTARRERCMRVLEETVALPISSGLVTDVPNPVPSIVPNVDTLRYDPYFTNQFGLGLGDNTLPLEQPSYNDSMMQDNFLDSAGLNVNVPVDFNWDVFDQLVYTQNQVFANDVSNGPPIF